MQCINELPVNITSFIFFETKAKAVSNLILSMGGRGLGLTSPSNLIPTILFI